MFRGKIQVINGNDDLHKVSENFDKMLTEPIVKELDVNLLKRECKRNKEEFCIICMTNIADHIVVPCGHQCGCHECLNEMLSRGNAQCPICRAPFNSVVKVYRTGYVDSDDNDNDNIDMNDQKIQQVTNANQMITIDRNIDDNNKILQNQTQKQIQINDKNKNEIEISVAPSENYTDFSTESNVGISIQVPDTPARKAVDVCCVIDISGSMQENAT